MITEIINMKKLLKIVSLSLTLSLLFSLISLAQEEALSSKTEEFYFNDTSDFIVKNADNLDKTEYYKDAIAIDHRVSDLFMNSNTLAAVSEKCDVSLGIHHNNSRGVWLSVLIEPQKKIPETILTSANGKWIHAFNGGAGITSYFTQPASYPKWTMLIEKDLGKKPAGTQIYAHVSVSATMSYGYMPTTMRTAIATVK